MIYLITLNNFVNFKHINPPNGGFFIAYSLLVFLKITKHKQQSQIIKEHWKCKRCYESTKLIKKKLKNN